MNEISINTLRLPIMGEGDFLVAASSFIHADRIAEFNVLIYVVEGQICVTEDQQDYEINQGEMLFLKSGVHHYGKQVIKQGTKWCYIHFYTDNVEDENNAAYPDYDQVCDVNTPLAFGEKMLYKIVLPKKLTNLKDTQLENQLKTFIKELHNNEPLRRWSINAKLFELLTKCAFYDKVYNINIITLQDKIALYLQEHSKEPFQSEKLERHFYLSYKYMSAVFKRYKNQTMQQYHTAMRMQHACKLLRSTSLTIGEISSQLGYTDMLYFSKCFHKFMGMSPRKYRKDIPLTY